MTCHDCQCEGAECLTRDRVRVCISCLYERTAIERDNALDEVRRLTLDLEEVEADLRLHKEERIRLRCEVLRLSRFEVKP